MRRLTLALLLALALAAPALAGDADKKRSIDARIARLQGGLAKQRRQEDALRGSLAVERLNNRLIDIYESDDVTSLDIILGAASIADALDKIDYMRAIADQDRRIARAVAMAKRQVTVARVRTARVRATVHQATRAIEIRTSQTREVRN